MNDIPGGNLNQQLQTLFRNLISIFGRARAPVSSMMPGDSIVGDGLLQPEDDLELDVLCDEISAECDRIQKLQAAFGYASSLHHD
jgi:hypothetical protein